MSDKEIRQEQKVLENTVKQIEDYTYLLSNVIDNKGLQIRSGNAMTGDQETYRNSIYYKRALDRAKREPFFGSLEITSKEEGYEKLYIGKHGIHDKNHNNIVVDWRRPIASVYYNFSPGKPNQKYAVELNNNNTVEYQVTVNKKKEFTVRDQKIIKILQQVANENSSENVTISEDGEELTVTDDFLQGIIENSETTGYLKEIIATIQKEQDKAIREPIDHDLIIQGVAGSGKSSIALHRLSYLLFNNKLLNPENVLIIGPSKLFISSIKDLLPDLELEKVEQITLNELMLEQVAPFLKNIKMDLSVKHYFEDILFAHENEAEQEIIKFKGSKLFLNSLEKFIEFCQEEYEYRIEQISIASYTLKKDDLLVLYDGYRYLPFSKRIEKFTQHVKHHFESSIEKEINHLKQQYETVTVDFLKGSNIGDSEIRQFKEIAEKVTSTKINKLKSELKKGYSEWLVKVKNVDIVSLYKRFLSYEMISALTNDRISEHFRNYELKTISYFDLAPIFYLYTSLYDNPKSYVHIVVDEAQDLSYTHFAILKKITKTMTILGDTEQSFYIDFGQMNWSSVNSLLQDGETPATYLKLETSYRSTKQIIEAANKILYNNQGLLHTPITPLNRNGKEVSISRVVNGEDLLHQIIAKLKEWNTKYNRIAIIHKTEEKAIKFTRLLAKTFRDEVSYVNPHQEVQDNKISVLTSYNSKGMEFDAVILVNVNDESFPNDDLHAKLLYVLLTRAQHEVSLYYNGLPSRLLDGLVEKSESGSIYDEIL